MAKKKRKKKRDQERNPIKLGLYTIVVLALIACLVFFVYRDRLKDQEFEQQISDLSASELSDMWAEFENEKDPGSVEEMDRLHEEEENAASEEITSFPEEEDEDMEDTPEPSVTEEAEETPEPDEDQPESTPSPSSEPDSDLTASPLPTGTSALTVLILNGTRKSGVAGYWKNVLEQAGYTNVVPATYTGTVGAQTVIYTDEVSKAEPFMEQFPNAVIQIGSITTGVEPTTDAPLPEHTDVYVLIGSSDAKTS